MQGSSVASWDMLIEDVKPLILGALSVLDLARAGACCREFQQAYRNRLAEERQELILLPGYIWGKPMVKTISRVLQHVLCGPGVYSDLDGFCAGLGFVHAEGDVRMTRHRSSPHLAMAAVLVDLEDASYMKGGFFTMRFMVRMDVPKPDRFVIHAKHFRESPGNDVQWEVSVIAALGSAPTVLGLLLAACTGGREAEAPVWRFPMTLRLWLSDMSAGAEGLREAGCVTAPLTQYAKSAVMEWWHS
jgi:hypothetical protein